MEKTSGVERYLGVLVKEFSFQTYLALFFIEHVTLTLIIRVLYIFRVCAGEYIQLCTCQLRTSARGKSQYTAVVLGF